MSRLVRSGLTAWAVGWLLAASVGTQSDATSCNIYKTGLTEVAEGRFAGALASFERVINGCQTVEIKAQAWLQVGLIRLRQWPPDVAGARTAADTITRTYLNTPSSPDGFILKGLTELVDGRSFENALTEFGKVDRNLTGSLDALAEAQYRIGEAQRLNHQPELALRTFQQIPLMYPRPEWAAKALLSAASCQVQLGQFRQAMELLQRVRRDYPTLDEAELALQRNGILYRLFLKGKDQELVPVMTSKRTYRDGVALAIDPLGQILLAHRTGLVTLKPDTGEEVSGPQVTVPASFEVRGVGMWGPVSVLAGEREILFNRPNMAPFRPAVPKADGSLEDVQITAMLANWRGDWLIADSKSTSIRRHQPDGKLHNVPFAARMRATRLAQNDLDDVAVLSPDQRVVFMLNRDASKQEEIPRRNAAQDYDFDSPVDVAFDVLGNVYVLDAGRNNIVVFDPSRQFKTRLSFPLKTVRKAAALAVDGRGRIYVLDRESMQVIGYQ